MSKLRVLDLFSGIGGFSLGLERTGGFETVAFCERDEYCQRVLGKHWPGVIQVPDIRQLDIWYRDLVGGLRPDVITAGFPCQPFSSAARGRNNAEDFWGYARRAVARFKPRWVIAENVPGIGGDGIDRVCDDLERSRYATRALDIDTTPRGRTRGRRRFFWVANADRQGQPFRAFDAEMARICALPGRRPDDACPLGVDDGLSNRVDRLKALGNAVVPQVVTLLGNAILAQEAQA